MYVHKNGQHPEPYLQTSTRPLNVLGWQDNAIENSVYLWLWVLGSDRELVCHRSPVESKYI